MNSPPCSARTVKHVLPFAVVAAALFVRPVPAADSDATARMVYYSGTVQGVGFRATAVEIARSHPVSGWVRNLADGRVQLLVEGPEQGVEKFLEAVRSRWKDHIQKEQIEKRDATGKIKGFTIVK